VRDIPGKRVLAGAFATLVALVAPMASAREVAWTSQFGAPSAYTAVYGVAADGRGGAVVAGLISGGALPGQTYHGGGDAFVRSYRADGSVHWTRQFGSAQGDQANRVALDDSGNVFVIGSTAGGLPGQTKVGRDDTFVRSYDQNGNERWTTEFGVADLVTYGVDIAVSAPGNIFVTGLRETADQNSRPIPGWLRKLDATGATVWERGFGSPTTGITLGGISVGGARVTVVGASADGFVMTYDTAGTLLWSRDIGLFTRPGDVDANLAGRIAVAGTASAQLSNRAGDNGPMFVRVYDANGSVIWTRQFSAGAKNASDVGNINGLDLDHDGNVYLAANVPQDDLLALDGGFGSVYDAYVARLNPDGSDAWSMIFSSGDATADSVALASDGFVYLGGRTQGGINGQRSVGSVDGFLMRIDQRLSCHDTKNPTGEEDGLVSAPIHQTLEPVFPAAQRKGVHGINCTKIVPLGL